MKSEKNKKQIGSLSCAEKPSYSVPEAYCILRTNLISSLPGSDKGKVIGITSPAPTDGKEYVSLDLSRALSKDGFRTLLVSGDMRKNKLDVIIGTEPGKGLSDILEGRAMPGETVVKASMNEDLCVISSGTVSDSPSELFDSERYCELIGSLRESFDYIILDLPPVLPFADTLEAGRKTDGVLLVVREGASKKNDLTRAVKALGYARIKILGFVWSE